MDWKERLKAESEELDGRIEKLLVFMGTQAFRDLDLPNQILLEVQFKSMQTYLKVLDERIRLNQID